MKFQKAAVVFSIAILSVLYFSLAANVHGGSLKPLPVVDNPKLADETLDKIGGRMMMVSRSKPDSLRKPQNLREFLVDSFAKFGYGYTSTLKKLADDGFGMQDVQRVAFIVSPATMARDQKITLTEVFTKEEVGYLDTINKESGLNLY